MFDVDDFETYVRDRRPRPRCATWPRSYAYDDGDDDRTDGEITLRAGADDGRRGAAHASCRSASTQAGVVVEDAKLTHLAYAPEIAQVMLRRQQAEAIIAARRRSCTARSAWSRWR